eukprot:TRINITY_DN902_c0_g1_i1.p1 TRINITY_DN902_c0_g1~~TRINITY_DN902_c0_g1_i1.p1  ORF type:complete len:581 (-),score=196.02 TRINITY_DN902_c0_g1_i1:404-1963(-)
MDTADGPVTGYLTRGVEHFLGVPFAAPPLGTLRFRAPQAVAPWDDPLDATSFKPACIQTGFSLQSFEETSEDCLTLNVYVPHDESTGERATQDGGPLPVMVWIHGGAFTAGSAANYAADEMLRHAAVPVVVVTINYRLGVFAYLTLEGVERNVGLLDQRAALKWVQANIAAFGGDPDRVTLFGESAGGASIALHLAMKDEPQALFHRGILESPGPWSYATVEEGEADAQKYASAVGCSGGDVLACLQALTVEELLDARGIGMNPVVGYDALPEQLVTMMEKGDIRDMPLIMGCNELEGDYFLDLVIGPDEIGNIKYQTFMAALFASSGELSYFLDLYEPVRKSLGNWRALSQAAGDLLITCGTEIASNATLSTSNNLYSYVFTHTSPYAKFNATHTSEIPYVFARYQEFTEKDDAVVYDIGGFWTNFASNGDPNGMGGDGSPLPHWPVYEPAKPDTATVRNIEEDPVVPLWKPFERDFCAAWNLQYFSKLTAAVNFNQVLFDLMNANVEKEHHAHEPVL